MLSRIVDGKDQDICVPRLDGRSYCSSCIIVTKKTGQRLRLAVKTEEKQIRKFRISAVGRAGKAVPLV